MNVLPRIISFLLMPVLWFASAIAQDSNTIIQSKQELRKFQQKPGYNNDTVYISKLIELGYLYSFSYPDSTLLLMAGNAERCRNINYKTGEMNTYLVTGDALVSKGMYKEALKNFDTSYELAKRNHFQNSLPLILNRIGTVYLNQGNYPEALSRFYESLKAAEAAGDNELVMGALTNIANAQFYQNKFDEAESTYTRMLKVAEAAHNISIMSHAHNNLGMVNVQQKNLSKALAHVIKAYNLAMQVNDREMLLNSTLSIAEVYYTMDSLQRAATLYQKGLQLATQTDHGSLVCSALIGLAKIEYKQGMLAEALANGLQALQKAKEMGQVQLLRDASEILSSVYEAKNDSRNSLTYFKQYKLYSDSMNSLESQRAVAIEKDKYEFSKKEADFERKTLQQRWLIFSAFAGLLLLAAILWIILRNRNRLKQTYKVLQHKNVVIENEKSKAEEALSRLQSTQAQLIQSEKMASLGELTAGIAHEIQNPLNFVNNFSEINSELIEEMNSETNAEEMRVIAADIKQNNEKITFHGKRADAIVKSMLQHSRKNTGQKEEADINAMCDEYLRLSYHGLRAKDKSFQAEFSTSFDKSIGNIYMVKQDMGRALLNLFNNAFYAVNDKKKVAGKDYKPCITVSTKKLTGNIEICIEDNANGIPQSIADKIFQPFFTTKPTGQGTGLGLSLTYDIITKEHRGTITLKSEESTGTTFIITLPSA